MKLQVELEDYSDEEEIIPPVAGAKRETYMRRDERTAARPEDVQAHRGDCRWWFDEGQNHRVENGHIVRDFPDDAWFIEVGDLDALLALIKSCEGKLRWWNGDYVLLASKRPSGKLVWVADAPTEPTP